MPAMQFTVVATDPLWPEYNTGINLHAPDADTATTYAFELLNGAQLMDGVYVQLPEKQQELGPHVGQYLFAWYDPTDKRPRMFAMPAVNAEHAIAQIEALRDTGHLFASAEPA